MFFFAILFFSCVKDEIGARIGKFEIIKLLLVAVHLCIYIYILIYVFAQILLFAVVYLCDLGRINEKVTHPELQL